MRIAQVAPLFESVPPKLYGGTERVVSYLTEELVSLGHDVTLFASGDSETRARLIAPCRQALRLGNSIDQIAPHLQMLEHLFQRLDEFDVIHFHCGYLHFPLCRRQPCRQVTTLHGRLDIPETHPLHREYSEMPLISISNAQRRPMPWANWQATIYHGLPEDLHTFRAHPGSYLAFLGRISPEKRVDRAIRIAQEVGLPLKIAAKVDPADRAYYQEKIEPLLRETRRYVEFIGEVGGKAKDEFLGNAHALLFPIDWPEPFGLVMIEAMACGTPVIAYRNGSVPEVMVDGVTGFIVDTHEAAVRAVQQVAGLSRRKCRQVFEERYTARRMAEDHLRVYERIVDRPNNRRVFLAAEPTGDGRAPRRLQPADASLDTGQGKHGPRRSGPRSIVGTTAG